MVRTPLQQRDCSAGGGYLSFVAVDYCEKIGLRRRENSSRLMRRPIVEMRLRVVGASMLQMNIVSLEFNDMFSRGAKQQAVTHVLRYSGLQQRPSSCI